MSETVKRIVPTVECFPNYLFHVLAVSTINFTSEYAERYRDSIDESDIKLLSSHKDLLRFAGAESTGFVYPFIFLPAYINPSSYEQVAEYYELFLRAIRAMDGETFIRHYGTYLDNQEKWTAKGVRTYLGQLFGYLNHNYLAETEAMVGIFVNNYEAYEKEVWPIEMPKLRQSAEKLEAALQPYDLIGRWEEITNLEFLFPEYQIVLCSAAKNGPDMNSLGYERNLFYAFSDTDGMIKNISHEIGTHIMIDCHDLWTPERPDLFYWAYEALAQHYNQSLFHDANSQAWSMPTITKFMDIYKNLANGNGGTRLLPRQMLLMAMDLA